MSEIRKNAPRASLSAAIGSVPCEVVIIGADDQSGILDKTRQILTYIAKTPSPALCDIAFTSGIEAKGSLEKAAVVASSVKELVDRLELLARRIEDGKAYISWAADTLARWWEISYGPVGTSPENGTRDSTQTTMVCLENLQVGTEYVVYVRGRCKDDTRSPWSSFITFYMSDNETITLPEQTVVDRNTHVMPNPTGGLATIFSSFRISTIEVYTSTGSLVKTMQVHSNGAEFNASNLPAGTYILRIRTSHGDTAKRLVKQ